MEPPQGLGRIVVVIFTLLVLLPPPARTYQNFFIVGKEFGIIQPVVDTTYRSSDGTDSAGMGSSGTNITDSLQLAQQGRFGPFRPRPPRPVPGTGGPRPPPPPKPPIYEILKWVIKFDKVYPVEVVVTWMDLLIDNACNASQKLTIFAKNGSSRTPLSDGFCGDIRDKEDSRKFCIKAANSVIIELQWPRGIGPKRLFSVYYQRTKCSHECMEVKKEEDGIIGVYSPNYKDGVYSTLHNCVRLLTVPDGNAMKIKFINFELQSRGMKCANSDMLKIYDVTKDRRLVGIYCGDQSDTVVYSGRKTLFVFTSDGAFSEGRFHLKVTTASDRKSNRLTVLPNFVDALPRNVSLADFPDELMQRADGTNTYVWLFQGTVASAIGIKWMLDECNCEANITIFDGPNDDVKSQKWRRVGAERREGTFTTNGLFCLVKLETKGNISDNDFTLTADQMPLVKWKSCMVDVGIRVNVTEDIFSGCSDVIYYVLNFRSETKPGRSLESAQVIFHEFTFPASENGRCEAGGFAIMSEESLVAGPFCGTSAEDHFSLLSEQGFISPPGTDVQLVIFRYEKEDAFKFQLEARIADCEGALWGVSKFVHPDFGGKPVCLQFLGYPGPSSPPYITIKPAWNGRVDFNRFEQLWYQPPCRYLLLLGDFNSGGGKVAELASSHEIDNEKRIILKWADCQNVFIHFVLLIRRVDLLTYLPDSCDYSTKVQVAHGEITRGSSVPVLILKSVLDKAKPQRRCSMSIYMYDDVDDPFMQCRKNTLQYYYEVKVLFAAARGECINIEEDLSETGCTTSDPNRPVFRAQLKKICSKQGVLNGQSVRIQTSGPQFRVTSDDASAFSIVFQLHVNYTDEQGQKISSNPECKCPVGFVEHRCNCYVFGTGASTWLEAQGECRRRHSNLTSIVDATEMDAIWEMLWTKWWPEVVKVGRTMEWIFIGIEGTRPEGNYTQKGNRWADGNPFVFSEWYKFSGREELRSSPRFVMYIDRDQPSPMDRASHCGAMYFTNIKRYGNWFKLPCAVPLPSSAFICKRPAERVPNDMSNEVGQYGDVSPRETLAKSKNRLCPQGWTFADDKCFRLLSAVNGTLFYEDAVELCQNYSGRLANVRKRYAPLFMKLFKIWMHNPEYGDIWAEKGENFTYLTPSGDVWVVTELPVESNASHVLCETKPEVFSDRCGPQQFQCRDRSCIIIDRRCDGVNDCADSSDERSCSMTEDEATRSQLYLSCTGFEDRATVPVSRYCDFVQDCGNGADESCIQLQCNSTTHFLCENGECVPQSRRCDGVKDCLDGTDEYDCTHDCHGFLCYGGTCIPHRAVGDIHADCPGIAMEDEVQRSPKDSCPSPDQVRCKPSHPYCFKRSQACVYEHDRYGYTKGCRDLSHLRHCREFQCPGMFQCSPGYCIPQRSICDGKWDCPDGQDERRCPIACPGKLKCGGKGETQCVDQSDVCDGFRHCQETGDDERYCDVGPLLGCKTVGYVVDCTGANLTSVPRVSQSSRALLFSGNRPNINADTFASLYQMAFLNLSNNYLERIEKRTFHDLFNLLSLDLSHNLLTHLEDGIFIGLTRLVMLDLGSNPLRSLTPHAFRGLSHLPSLVLEDCSITNVPDNAFVGLRQLNSLSLRNASVMEVSESGFYGLWELENMDLRDNKISIMTPTMFSNLSELHLLRTDELQFCCAYSQVPHVDDDGEGRLCTPSPDEFSSCTDLMKWSVLSIVVWALGVAAFGGNLFVIIWRLVKERSNVMNLLILNLGLSDFLMGVYLLIIATADTFYSGRYAYYDKKWRSSGYCTTASILSMLSSEMSVYMLVVITADRVITIIFTFDLPRLTLKKAGVLVAVGWAVTIFLSVLPLFGGSYFDGYFNSNAVCLSFNVSAGRERGWEFTLFLLVINLAAFLFIFVAYVVIYRHYKVTQKALAQVSQLTSAPSTKSREISMARKLVFIISTDFVCWVPLITIKFIAIGGIRFPDWVAPLMAVIVLPLNSSLNPFLYTISALRNDLRRAKRKSNSHSVETDMTVHVRNKLSPMPGRAKKLSPMPDRAKKLSPMPDRAKKTNNSKLSPMPDRAKTNNNRLSPMIDRAKSNLYSDHKEEKDKKIEAFYNIENHIYDNVSYVGDEERKF